MFVKDAYCLDTFYSDEEMKQRVATHISNLFDAPVEKKNGYQSISRQAE